MSADPTKKQLAVVLCWHMHQPEYRDQRSGFYAQPWTYLHVMKDYTDMAAHLEANPAARAVVNFAPTLLEQIVDYAAQITAWRDDGAALHDSLLAALAGPTLHEDPHARLRLLEACRRVNQERMVAPFPAFAKLLELAAWFEEHPETLAYADERLYGDLLVWYHLAWLGETVRQAEPLVGELLNQKRHFSLHQRRELVCLIGRLAAQVIPRYRALYEAGQVELSVTPYAHPIIPLLLDFASARETVADAPLPVSEHYPDGEARARRHLERGLEVFESCFDHRPAGCWPAEGALCSDTVRLLDAAGFGWSASGGQVGHNARQASQLPDDGGCIHHAHQLRGTRPLLFFRDDGLSDLIGFRYSGWHADDAVADLIVHLEGIAAQCDDLPNAVVPIILDGENAWEYYPDNGSHFLSALYRRLAEHPGLDLTTFGALLKRQIAPTPLQQVPAGSWVYGTLSTWIGDADKNRAWDMLVDAKHCYDQVMASGKLTPDQQTRAERQLAICEGSDWCWWFGDYNPGETVTEFDRLYRRHLGNLYQFLGQEPPDYLSRPFSKGGGSPASGGTMRPGLPGTG